MNLDRTPLHVVVGGREAPGVESFVLIHGFGATHFTWRHWVPTLEQLGRVVLVDLKGFGASEKPDDRRYGPLDQAALVESLVERLPPGPVTLVGHSFGGGVALLTAVALRARSDEARRERPLARLVLVAGAAYAQPLPPFVRLARTPRLTAAALRMLGPGRVIRYALRAIVHDPTMIVSEQIETYAAPLATAEGVRATLEAARQIMPDDLDHLTARYAAVDVPTLLLWGRSDPVVPLWVGQRLARELPRARLEVMETCGHVPHEERPAESLEILVDFLERTRG